MEHSAGSVQHVPSALVIVVHSFVQTDSSGQELQITSHLPGHLVVQASSSHSVEHDEVSSLTKAKFTRVHRKNTSSKSILLKIAVSSAGSVGPPPTGSVGSPPTGSVGSPPTGSVGSPPTGSVGSPPTGSVGSPPTGSVGSPPVSVGSPPVSVGSPPVSVGSPPVSVLPPSVPSADPMNKKDPPSLGQTKKANRASLGKKTILLSEPEVEITRPSPPVVIILSL